MSGPDTLTAYFDGSRFRGQCGSAPDLGIFAVGGYVGSTAIWNSRFTPSWRAALDSAAHAVSEYKASDCRRQKRQFAGWTRDECNDLTRRVVDVLVECEPSILGLGAAAVVDYTRIASPELRRDVEREAWIWCLSDATHRMLRFTEEFHRDTQIRVVFDDEGRQMPAIRRAFDTVRALRGPEYLRRISDISAERSDQSAPVQAADLLAFETYREMWNRAQNPPVPVSTALSRLVHGQPHFAVHADLHELGANLRRIERGDVSEGETFDFPRIYASITTPRFFRD